MVLCDSSGAVGQQFVQLLAKLGNDKPPQALVRAGRSASVARRTSFSGSTTSPTRVRAENALDFFFCANRSLGLFLLMFRKLVFVNRVFDFLLFVDLV